MNKKYKFLIIFAFVFVLPLSLYALRDNSNKVYTIDFIPDKMAAGSIIKFVSNNEFIVEQGAVTRDTFKKLEIDKDDPEISEDTNIESYPDPKVGMVGTYANDGLILRIIEPQ